MTTLQSISCRLALIMLCSLGLAGCSETDSLERIEASGELRVITRNSPTTYFQDRNGPAGFEHALASLLAEELGVDLNMQPEFSLDAIFRRLRREEADIAAAGLTLTGQRMSQYPHSTPYASVTPMVVYVAGTFRPHAIADLRGKRVVALAGSSHVDALLALREGGFSFLEWEELGGADSLEVLEYVNQGRADFAIIDSHEFEVGQGLYPRLRTAFALGPQQELAWFLPPGQNHRRLQGRIHELFHRLEASGEMARLREIHFGHAETVSRVGSHTFSRNVEKRLPEFKSLISQVASEYQMDWELLAAIAYQESHWNPTATSPTGVRGMMMLTLPTAGEMGISNRLDPAESLRGGAGYLKNIKRRLPSDISEPDLTWFALAAYNVGMGHLEDARVITEKQGGNPHLWADVMQRLPLLQEEKYYRQARHGFARGTEPVTYVQNIRHYYAVLQWEDIARNRTRAPEKTDDYLPGPIRPTDLTAL